VTRFLTAHDAVTMVHAVKYRKEDKLKIDIIETKHNPEKQIQNKTTIV